MNQHKLKISTKIAKLMKPHLNPIIVTIGCTAIGKSVLILCVQICWRLNLLLNIVGMKRLGSRYFIDNLGFMLLR